MTICKYLCEIDYEVGCTVTPSLSFSSYIVFLLVMRATEAVAPTRLDYNNRLYYVKPFRRLFRRENYVYLYDGEDVWILRLTRRMTGAERGSQ